VRTDAVEYGDRDSIEGVPDSTLIRRAHDELVKPYYRAGPVREGDRLLKKADDYVVYSVPEAATGKQWRRAKKYCAPTRWPGPGTRLRDVAGRDSENAPAGSHKG